MMKMQSFCVDSVHNTILWISKKEQSMIQKKKKYQITDKEDATSLPKESFSFLPTKPITHCMKEHSAGKPQAHSNPRASPPAQLGTSGQFKTRSRLRCARTQPPGLPWTQRGLQRCPTPCFAFLFLCSHSIKYYLLGIHSVPILILCSSSSPNPAEGMVK